MMKNKYSPLDLDSKQDILHVIHEKLNQILFGASSRRTFRHHSGSKIEFHRTPRHFVVSEHNGNPVQLFAIRIINGKPELEIAMRYSCGDLSGTRFIGEAPALASLIKILDETVDKNHTAYQESFPSELA